MRAGDIGAAIGLKSTKTGDTLADADQPIILESMTFPEPVIRVAIEPKTKADQDKLAEALAKLAEEDPTFRVRADEETGQTIISGMGELHLEIIVDRLQREFKVDANVGRPQVAYRETIRKPAREGRRASSSGSPAAAASTATWSSTWSRPRRARASCSRTRSSAARSRASTSPRAAGDEGSDGERRDRRLPAGRHQGDAHRRLVPRRRLERDGVQDRRLDGLQGGRAAAATRRCSSRSWTSRS